MPSNIRTTLVSTLLLGIFSAVFLFVQYLFPVSLKQPYQWGHPRPLVPDGVVQELIRQLIAQADSGGPPPVLQAGVRPPRAGADAADVEPTRLDFRISRVLLEHQPVAATIPVLSDAQVRYLYGQESASMMRQ